LTSRLSVSKEVKNMLNITSRLILLVITKSSIKPLSLLTWLLYPCIRYNRNLWFSVFFTTASVLCNVVGYQANQNWVWLDADQLSFQYKRSFQTFGEMQRKEKKNRGKFPIPPPIPMPAFPPAPASQRFSEALRQKSGKKTWTDIFPPDGKYECCVVWCSVVNRSFKVQGK
jgi:hypothetical protein